MRTAARRLLTLVWLALRNLGRELRRSALTAAAMAVGLALLIVSRTLSDGVHEDWIESGVRLGDGHVVFNAPGYRDGESLEDAMSAAQLAALLDAVVSAEPGSQTEPEVGAEPERQAEPEFRAAPESRAEPERAAGGRESVEDRDEQPLAQPVLITPRVSARGLASSADGAVPAWIQGVDPGAELAFSELGAEVLDGRYLQEGDRLHAFIGEGMAVRLGLRVGSRMVLTAQSASGDIEGQLVRVTGLFRTGLVELDEAIVHIPLGTARSWLGIEGATSVAALLPHSRLTAEYADAAAGALSPHDVEVTRWEQSSPDLYSAVRIDDGGDWVFKVILYAIVALAVLNAVFMSVLHRKRELGLLRALGLSARETGGVVFIEGVLLTAVSGLVGTAAGFALVWVFFRNGLDLTGLMPPDLTFGGIVFDPVMHPAIELQHLVQSVILTAGIGLSASLYPAWQAAALDPAESVKVE